MDYTTIQISRSTREKLNGLRAHKRMTYDELLNALMSLIPEKEMKKESTARILAHLFLEASWMSKRKRSTPQTK